MSEAYRRVVAFIISLLNDEHVCDTFLSESPAKYLAFIGSPEEAGIADRVKWERALIFAFMHGLIMTQLMRVNAAAASAILPIRPDLTIFDMISILTLQPADSQYGGYSRAGTAMANFLSCAATHYGKVGEEQERERLRATASSVLRMQEFTFLASRASHLVDRYGSKAVEERFEQQLSLALQSFGFRTIPTTRGARRGDIICITGRASPPAVLVEAKTSGRPYKLPVADQRALLEYAQRLKDSSWFQFPLRLICIFGPQPDKRLAERLRRLETTAGVPVRYCTAAALTALLMRPPSGVTADDLIESLLRSDQIVSREHLISVSSESEDKLTALRNYERYSKPWFSRKSYT